MTTFSSTIVTTLGAGLILASAMAAPVRAEDTTTYEITLEGQTFTPSEIRVEAGKPFMIKFTNANAAPAEFESIDLKIEKIAPPKTTVMVRAQAVDKGTYVFVDEFQEDVAKGTVVAE
jgi:hypothetical protein